MLTPDTKTPPIHWLAWRDEQHSGQSIHKADTYPSSCGDAHQILSQILLSPLFSFCTPN